MDLSLSDEQQLLVASFGSLLDKLSAPGDIRAAEPLGFDARLWSALQDLGPTAMAVAEDRGGWGATTVDLCLVGESLGRRCASVPVIECQVAARLLDRLGSPLLPQVLEGTLATLALHPPIAGTARLVPGGAVAELVLVRQSDAVVAVRNQPAAPLVPNHGSLPLADVPLDVVQELASGADAVSAFEAAIDEWLLLTASALVGVSAAALASAVEYAKDRHAFGAPIGSYQGIAHPLADVATRIDGARLLALEAAWSADVGDPEAAERACMAFAFAAEVARLATYWGVHTLGGYGVMVEHDAQLRFRRARGWAGVYGSPETAYRRVATHRYGSNGA